MPSDPGSSTSYTLIQAQDERIRLLALTADIGTSLTTRPTLAEMLRGCAEAFVVHLDAAFARVWVLEEAEDVLVLKASAGLYTHLNGPHGRVPVGQFKIGLIAQEGKPHLTNAVVGDPRVGDQEWAAREGMVSFAGYPLSVEGRVVGVVAMFARHPLSVVTLETLGAVADEIALGIEGKRTEAALRASEERLRDTQARLEAALLASGIATWTWDLTTDLLVVDAEFARLFSVSPEYAAGGRSEGYFRAIHPDDRPLVERAIAEAVDGRDVYEAEYRVVMPDRSYRWLSARGRVERDASGQAVGLPGSVQDITERVERQRRERFLTDLAERARGLTDPDEVVSDAVRSVGEFLGVSRCLFADIDIEADTCAVPPHYRADGSVASIAGVFPISAFGPFVVAEYKAGRTAVVDDVRADRVKAPPESLAAYEAIGVRAYVAAPVLHSARLVSALAVHSAEPRHWTPEEVELLQTVVERTWLTVEVTRQKRALAHEAQERREALERTAAVLDSITDAFFALDTDWRFNYMNDEAERLLLRSRSDLLGKGVWEEFPAAVGSLFEQHYRRAVAEQIAVTFEAYYPPPLDAWFEVRAFPSEAGLSVYFHGISDRKAAEKSRDEAQAALLRHEHTIASQLQAALQPEPPGAVPGLRLARHYQAALPEAGVGGDFFDVFSIGKGCTALVLGDLAGKGLAAAAQVATVRNTLRAFLYIRPTVAEAVHDLNRVLAENGLLTGFATLFVGAYDAGTCVLNYCNCGQEPALVRRALTGAVEQLLPTGPVMGAIEGARFSEAMVTLAPGDALAVFSDGLTECGPDRAAMLEIAGVMALFGQPLGNGGSADVQGADPQATAEQLAQRLIDGADRYAQGGVRDDVVLLVGVVT